MCASAQPEANAGRSFRNLLNELADVLVLLLYLLHGFLPEVHDLDDIPPLSLEVGGLDEQVEPLRGPVRVFRVEPRLQGLVVLREPFEDPAPRDIVFANYSAHDYGNGNNDNRANPRTA